MVSKPNLLRRVLLSGFCALSLVGCSFFQPQKGSYKGYNFDYTLGFSNIIYLYSKEGKGYINFADWDRDWKVNKFGKNNIKQGDSIEMFANMETGQEILNQIRSKKK